jgi:hypothetical protein
MGSMEIERQIIVFDVADLAEGHQVDADPAGHPFCIGWHGRDEGAPQRSLEVVPVPPRAGGVVIS